MEKKVVINLHGIDVSVIIIDTKSMIRTVHYSYGQLYVSCPIDTSLSVLKMRLEKMFDLKTLLKFDKDQLYSDSYCYVLGEKRRLIRPFSYLEPKKEDLIIKNNEDLIIKLKKLAYDILVSRVRRYEIIMQTKKHEIKITAMYAARGKNYYRKGLLTFAYELVHFSLELIDAIVIHELAHDFQQNHSKKFYEIVYTYCSDYDSRIKKLSYGVKK